eukprot:jgi/Tetstr1/456063/TSEL_042833.t1
MPSLTFRHPPIAKSASDDVLTSQKILLTSCGSNRDVVRKAICAETFHQAAKMNGIGDHPYLIFSSVLVIKIPGRPFPEDVILSKTPQTDFSFYVEDSVKQALTLHPLEAGAGDVLIYITGRDEMETTCVALQSQLPAALHAKIFDQAEEGTSKSIVSTNIAETSLTVDGIIYAIVSSCCKFKAHNPKMGLDLLAVDPLPLCVSAQAAEKQHSGPGTCYCLFTEISFRDERLAGGVGA